ncbi:low molecular weight protein-tyrosine-phosphatase [Rhodoferax sp. WC2427]|uniref:low molecular weight protein-tyrosine-phosphatase n=1 Tax=Rhodoferax sp. WC2427 TaxID=3234144 RepID=UPI0034655C21
MAQIVATQMAKRNGLSKQFHFESAGTHASQSKMRMDSRAVTALERRGYPVSAIRSRPVEPKDFKRFDLILAMDLANYSELQRMCPPEFQQKLKMFLSACKGVGTDEVPDPYYGNSEGFERVLDLCEAGVQALLGNPMG